MKLFVRTLGRGDYCNEDISTDHKGKCIGRTATVDIHRRHGLGRSDKDFNSLSDMDNCNELQQLQFLSRLGLVSNKHAAQACATRRDGKDGVCNINITRGCGDVNDKQRNVVDTI